MKSPKRFCLCTWHWGQQGKNDGSKGTEADWLLLTSCDVGQVTYSSLSMLLHLWSGMVRALTSPGHWIIACQVHYCAFTYIISFNLLETGMIIRGWLRRSKDTCPRSHSQEQIQNPGLWASSVPPKACNNYTNLVSVPWRLKSRERDADGGTWHRAQSWEQRRLHFTENRGCSFQKHIFLLFPGIFAFISFKCFGNCWLFYIQSRIGDGKRATMIISGPRYFPFSCHSQCSFHSYTLPGRGGKSSQGNRNVWNQHRPIIDL